MTMPDDVPGLYPRLMIDTLSSLRKSETEVLRRLEEDSIARKMMALDPLQALQRVGVTLSADTREQWQGLTGGTFPQLSDSLFNEIAAQGGPDMEVTFLALLPPESGSDPAGVPGGVS
jgi:hypothetical protein